MRPVLSIWRGLVAPGLRPHTRLSELAADVCAEFHEDLEDLRSHDRSLDLVALRRTFAGRAIAQGHSRSAVARFLGRHPSTIQNMHCGKPSQRERTEAHP